MPDGTDAVPTDVTEGVEAAPAAVITPPAPSVSAQTPPAPVSQSRSDPEARVRSLQGLWEKTKAERDALTIEKAQLLGEIDSLKTQGQSQLAVSAEATRNAIARAEQLSGENTNLKGELARLKFVVEHPELMPWVALVPATDDPQKLQEVADTIKQARDRDVQALNKGILTGAAVPPANPAKPSGSTSTEDLNRALKEAWSSGNYKEFERLKNEAASKLASR